MKIQGFSLHWLQTFAASKTGWIKIKLKMNGSKTEFIVFGSKHKVQTYTLKSLKIDDTIIRVKLVIKFLGA